jgi:hypothetical protein
MKPPPRLGWVWLRYAKSANGRDLSATPKDLMIFYIGVAAPELQANARQQVGLA